VKVTNFAAFTNGVAGTSSSFASSAFFLWDTVRLSGQAVVSSGTFNGSFALQVSNDKAVGAFPGQFQPTNWNTLGSTTVLANASASATVKSFMFPTTELSYAYGRIVFTDGSSGTALGSYNFNIVAFML
jgi:hypothetical protein